MTFFRLCFILYFLKLSADYGLRLVLQVNFFVLNSNWRLLLTRATLLKTSDNQQQLSDIKNVLETDLCSCNLLATFAWTSLWAHKSLMVDIMLYVRKFSFALSANVQVYFFFCCKWKHQNALFPLIGCYENYNSLLHHVDFIHWQYTTYVKSHTDVQFSIGCRKKFILVNLTIVNCFSHHNNFCCKIFVARPGGPFAHAM